MAKALLGRVHTINNTFALLGNENFRIANGMM